MDSQVPPPDGGQDPVNNNMGENVEHPPVLENATPNFILQYCSIGLEFFQLYGWFIFIALIALYYLKHKLTPKFENYRRKKEEQDYLNVDPNVARQRMESMEMARRRLQEKYDAQAAKHAEEMKEKEREQRLAKIADWELHQSGGGYRSKLYKPQQQPAAGASGQSSSESKPSKPKKTVYRNTGGSSSSDNAAPQIINDEDYSPLAGGGSDSCAWRPSRRSGGG